MSRSGGIIDSGTALATGVIIVRKKTDSGRINMTAVKQACVIILVNKSARRDITNIVKKRWYESACFRSLSK